MKIQWNSSHTNYCDMIGRCRLWCSGCRLKQQRPAGGREANLGFGSQLQLVNAVELLATLLDESMLKNKHNS